LFLPRIGLIIYFLIMLKLYPVSTPLLRATHTFLNRIVTGSALTGSILLGSHSEVKAQCAAFNSKPAPTTICQGGTANLFASVIPVNRAVQFTQAGSYVSLPTNNAGNALKQNLSQITIEAWVYPTLHNNNTTATSNANPTIISTSQGQWALRLAAGKLQIDWGFTSGARLLQTIGTNPIALNTWSHLAVTYNGTTITAYVNGNSIGTISRLGQLSFNPGTCSFIGNDPTGCASSGAAYQFMGRMDEVRIYNVARPQGAISAERGFSVADNQPNMIGYYRFNELNGLTTDDATDNNNGTFTATGVTRATGAPVQNFVLYEWSPAAGLSDTYGNSVDASPLTTTDYTVTASYAGCAGVQSIVTITVAEVPANAGNDTTVCSGKTLQLGTAPEAGATYSWDPVMGLSDPNSSQPTVTLTNSGTQPDTVHYTVTMTSGVDGCTGTDTISIIVNPIVKPQGIASPSTVALFGNLTLSVQNQIPGAVYSWELVNGSIPIASNGTGQIGSGLHPKAIVGSSITVPAHQTGLVPYLLYQDLGSCTSTDTVYVQVNCLPALAGGTYTINDDFQTGGSNFRTIRDAAYRISHCGISGPVHFRVAANSGPYTQRVELLQIPGASATNKVVFHGNNQTLLYNSQLNYYQAAVTLNGADYVTIDSLNIDFTPTSIAGWGVHLYNAADHNTISNSTITLNNTILETRGWMGIVATASNASHNLGGNNANDLRLIKNTITGGVSSIRITGTAAQPLSGIVIDGNSLSDAHQSGIALNYASAPVIKRNQISTRAGETAAIGISLLNIPNHFSLTRNRITNVGQYGIYLTNVNTTGSTRAMMANNMVGGGFSNTVSASAIYLGNADNIDILFNSVNLTGNAPGAGLDVPKIYSTGLDIRNNSFAYTGTGPAFAMRIFDTSMVNELDFNNYYSTGSSFVYYARGTRSNLTALRNTPGGPAKHDSFSKQGNPNYVSSTDLHATGTFLANSGKNLPTMVADDFDGNERTVLGNRVDIGADEFFGSFRVAAEMAASGATAISAYPNPIPSGTAVQVEVKAEVNEQLTYQVADVLGRIVLTGNKEVNAGTTVVNLPTENLSKGMYILNLQLGDITEQVKLIKE
jgi:hypothetical protein